MVARPQRHTNACHGERTVERAWLEPRLAIQSSGLDAEVQIATVLLVRRTARPLPRATKSMAPGLGLRSSIHGPPPRLIFRSSPTPRPRFLEPSDMQLCCIERLRTRGERKVGILAQGLPTSTAVDFVAILFKSECAIGAHEDVDTMGAKRIFEGREDFSAHAAPPATKVKQEPTFRVRRCRGAAVAKWRRIWSATGTDSLVAQHKKGLYVGPFLYAVETIRP